MNPFQKEHEQMLQNQSDCKEERIIAAKLIMDEIRDPETVAHQKISKEYENVRILLRKDDLSPNTYNRLKMFQNYRYSDHEIQGILNSISYMRVLIVNNDYTGDDFVSVEIQQQ